MKSIYELIESNSLDENALIDLLVNGFDLNDESHLEHDDEAVTPIMAAINAESIETLRLLLDFGAENIYTVANDSTAFNDACGDGNVEMLFLLIKKLVSINERAAQKGDEGAKEALSDLFYYSKKHSDTNAHERKLFDAILSDSELNRYQEIKDLISKASLQNVGMEMSGGNADDTIECATIDFKDLGTVKYMYQSNWSYGVVNIRLDWVRNGEIKQVVRWNVDHKYTITPGQLKDLRALAITFGLGALPVTVVLKFFSTLLSYMVQTNRHFEGWQDHPLYDYIDENVLSTAELMEAPIEKWKSERYALDISK